MTEKIATDPVNLAIKKNEEISFDWELNELAKELYRWVKRFNKDLFKDEEVPVPAISFERTRINTLGHYVIGRNAFGVRENINLNYKHLNRPLWNHLSTLLHEMMHSWEYLYTDKKRGSGNWYHTVAFRRKLQSFGIKCEKEGYHPQNAYSDPFVSLLKHYGVEIIEEPYIESPESKPVKPKGKSTLKKWECDCTSVRVGKREFEAKCLKCEEQFRLVG